jgi:hypothetical protein
MRTIGAQRKLFRMKRLLRHDSDRNYRTAKNHNTFQLRYEAGKYTIAKSYYKTLLPDITE